MRELLRLLLILIVVMVLIFYLQTDNFANPSYFGQAACAGLSMETPIKDVSEDCVSSLLLAAGCTVDSELYKAIPQFMAQNGADTLGKYIGNLGTISELVKQNPVSLQMCKGPLCGGGVNELREAAEQMKQAQPQQAPDAFLDY